MSSVGRSMALMALVIAAISLPGRLQAQEGGSLLDRCATFGVSSESSRRCNLMVQTLEILQPPLAMTMSGGNPVPGTASTLGMRLGSIPRLSLGGRINFLGLDLPQALDFRPDTEIDLTLTGLSIDAAVGILPGSTPLPTVGGVASLDLLASIGIIPLPTGSGFESGSPFSWALGLRGGIFRESFTLPGISVSAIYRHLGRSTLGDPGLVETEGYLNLSVASLSFRAAASKRILGLGVTAGAGYDRYSSNGTLGFTTSGLGGSPEYLGFRRLKNNRTSLFGNLSYTLLILHLVGELGWQQGGDRLSVPLPAGAEVSTGGHLFGGLAARISI